MSSSYNQGRITLDARFHKLFQVSNLYRVKGGRTEEHFEKDALFHEEHRKNRKL